MSAIAVAVTRDVRIKAGPAVLEGTLAVPEAETGIALFAHGSGTGRLEEVACLASRWFASHLG
jgi:hypothetical protein